MLDHKYVVISDYNKTPRQHLYFNTFLAAKNACRGLKDTSSVLLIIEISTGAVTDVAREFLIEKREIEKRSAEIFVAGMTNEEVLKEAEKYAYLSKSANWSDNSRFGEVYFAVMDRAQAIKKSINEESK